VPLGCTYRDTPPCCRATAVCLLLPAVPASTELQSRSRWKQEIRLDCDSNMVCTTKGI
jgi:hypothetical protein